MIKNTVKDILQLKGFSKVEVVAGAKGLHRQVKSTSLMEVPDIFPYVSADTLLLTTLYPIHDNREALERLIPGLAERGLAGICIKPARYIESIPPLMIEQAEALDFPLIRLADDANLSSLSNEVLELFLNEHVSVLEFRNYIHEGMMQLFLTGASPERLVDTFAEMIRRPVLLFDREEKIRYVSKDLAGHEVGCQREDRLPLDQARITIDDEVIDERAFLLTRIKAGSDAFGYLMGLRCDGDNENLKVALSQASLLLASAFLKNKAIQEKERNYLDAFIRELLQGKINTQIEAIEKARSFGWQLEFPQIILILKSLAEEERDRLAIYEGWRDTGAVEAAVVKCLERKPSQIKSVYLDDSFVVFINAIFLPGAKEAMKRLGDHLIGSLSEGEGLGIGISNPSMGLESFSEAYHQAQRSIDIGRTLSGSGFVSHYDDLKVINLVREIGDRGLLDQFVQDKLGALIRYDRTHDLSLLETLRVLIEANLNLQKASKRLFIHYNTLRYRIEKIKELGVSLDDGFEIGEIVLAYHVHLWLRATKEL